jgi:hypothetical protein
MHTEDFTPKGTLLIELRGPDGGLKDSIEVENLVVSVGLAYIASRMKDATATAMTHMAIGSGAVAPAAGNTTLGTELGRVALGSTSIVTTNVANDAIQYQATFPAGTGTGAVTEAGIFNAGAAGTMLCRTTFSVINKGALDSLTITWKVTAQ